jgi:hypothetical protein
MTICARAQCPQIILDHTQPPQHHLHLRGTLELSAFAAGGSRGEAEGTSRRWMASYNDS